LNDGIDVYPPSLRKDLDLTNLQVVKGFPGRKKSRYIHANEILLNSQSELALNLLKSEEWDLFFLYTSVLDMIQHYFWNLCDETDPTYPGPNEFQNTIKKFYRMHDQLVGLLMQEMAPETTLIILSDHGHGMRPVNVFNANEFLRQQNYLVLKSRPMEKHFSSWVDWNKLVFLSGISRLQLGEAASKVLKIIPWAKNLYSSPISIDWERTIAFATNLSGIKAYSYSGIMIKRDNLSESEYENIRTQIIKSMIEMKDPLSERNLVRWISRREDLYHGPFINKYPDIVFELQDDIGVGLTADGNLFGKAESHQLVPGSHKSDSAVFIINKKIPDHEQQMELIDVTPTIFSLLGIQSRSEFEGKSII